MDSKNVGFIISRRLFVLSSANQALSTRKFRWRPWEVLNHPVSLSFMEIGWQDDELNQKLGLFASGALSKVVMSLSWRRREGVIFQLVLVYK
jgi:hypothetical protein